jgi:hypothetical protein
MVYSLKGRLKVMQSIVSPLTVNWSSQLQETKSKHGKEEKR